MADYITGISVGGVEKKIDYNSLANLPESPTDNNFTDTYKNRLDTLTDDYIKSLITDANEVAY